jgi:phytol kinase
MSHPLVSVMVVLSILCTMLGVLSLYRRLGAVHPELLRKCLHVTMGAVTLWFPLLFDELWPVLLLAGVSVVLLASLRLVPALQTSVGQVLHSVGRFSLGEFSFVLAVVLLWAFFVNGQAEPPLRRLLLYLIPLLVLTIADAAAALVGVYLGRCQYPTLAGTRSLEGSIAFFFSALLCTHVPLVLVASAGWDQALVLAVFVAALVTMCEAFAWGGLDNLLLPLLAYRLLALHWV